MSGESVDLKLQNKIKKKLGQNSTISGLPIDEHETDTENSNSRIVVSVESSEEHPLTSGNWRCSLMVQLISAVHNTTQAQDETYWDAVMEQMMDDDLVKQLNNYSGLTVFGVREKQTEKSIDDNKWIHGFTATVYCAPSRVS